MEYNLEAPIPKRIKYTRLTDEKKLTVRKKYMEGVLVKQILEEEGISPNTLYKIIGGEKKKKKEVEIKNSSDIDEFTRKIMMDVYT